MDLDISDEELQNAIRTEKTFQQRSRLMMAALLACVMLMGSAIISLDVNAVAMAPASAKKSPSGSQDTGYGDSSSRRPAALTSTLKS